MTWNRWVSEVYYDLCGTDSGYAPLPEPNTYADVLSGDTAAPLQWMLNLSLSEAIEEAQVGQTNERRADVRRGRGRRRERRERRERGGSVVCFALRPV
jgi:hypothetical protein